MKTRSKIITSIIIIVIAGSLAGGYMYSKNQTAPRYEYVTVAKGEVVQEVSVTGQVKPAESVDLAFQRGGRVSVAAIKVGEAVRAGQTLAVVDNADLRAQLAQAIANRDAEIAKLHELQQGARPEDIASAQTLVVNAQRTLEDAEQNVLNVKNKAEADLQSSYDSAVTALKTAARGAKNSLIVVSDIQSAHFYRADQEGNTLAEAKAAAILKLFDAADAGRYTSESVNALGGGLYDRIENMGSAAPDGEIDSGIEGALDALKKVQTALSAVPLNSSLTSTEKTNLATEKTAVSGTITSVSAKQQAIAVQKASNSSAIAAAQSAVTTAQNNLAAAQDTLRLRLAGTVPQQISAQQARVASAQANVQNYNALIAETFITAPFHGIATKVEAKAGEIAAAGTPVISMISEALFQIEANVPEADIAKIKVGNTARVTLDAYGSEVKFEAVVAKIDPGETIIESVATYKVTLQFIKKDNRLKPGMTANIDILTAKHENTLYAPQRAIATDANGNKTVTLLLSAETDKKKAKIKEIKITAGLRGSDGRVEVISGLQEGDKAVTNIQ